MQTVLRELCVTGTDATHAEHIETIKSRMYVGLTADQRFLPGELGMGLVEGMYTTYYNILNKIKIKICWLLIIICFSLFRLQLDGL